MQQLDLRLAHLDCEHDAARLRRAMEGLDGVAIDQLLASAGRVRLTIDETKTSPSALSAQLQQLGFPITRDVEAGPAPPWRNPKVLASVTSGVLLFFGWLLSLAEVPTGVLLAVYGASALVGAYYFAREAIEELLFEREVGIELLMTVAAVVAFALGEWGEAAMLAFLYSISEALEGYTEAKTRGAVRALMKLAPKVATVRRDGRELEVPVEEVQIGDSFLVKPGQSVPTDGVVIVGRSSVNQAPVTGESVPVDKVAGDTVFAGSINGEGSLEVQATKTYADNTIARIIQLVEEAQERKGKSQRFIERFGKKYSPAVLLLGVLLAVIPPLAIGVPWTAALTRATVFIVAAAPCALVISIPITLVASLGTGARRGVLIKGGVFVEELAKVQVVALDKTGTITRGEPEVTDVIYAAPAVRTPEEVLSIATGIERHSQHPLAQAIVRYGESHGRRAAPVEDFRSLTGAGAQAMSNGTQVYLGKPSLFEVQLGVPTAAVHGHVQRLQSEGKTVVLIGDGKAVWALFAIRDTVRDNAAAAISALHAAGLKRVVMLTGDNVHTAQTIATEVGIDEVFAELTPEGKVEQVRALARQYGHVAMVGDGVNDAPALAEATVGIAMGAAGTDVALETADVALMSDDLEKLVYALRLARRNQTIVRQNLTLSLVVIAALVIGAVSGAFGLPTAVIGHELSELLVIANGLRMLKV